VVLRWGLADTHEFLYPDAGHKIGADRFHGANDNDSDGILARPAPPPGSRDKRVCLQIWRDFVLDGLISRSNYQYAT
jgi:hypothetical protein